MISRKYLALFAVVALIALAGCGAEETQKQSDSNAKDLANDVGENVSGAPPGGSYQFEIRMTEANQLNLVRAQPPFQMERSLERANLIRRYQYLNDRNNVHHVYLMSRDGDVISYFVAQGKVSSVNSKLTNDAQIVASEQCLDSTWEEDRAGCFQTVESPQMDGSYGTNGDAIFFFTTDGDYVEYNGQYVVSEQPLNIQTSVSLTHQVNHENASEMSGGN